MILAEQIYCCVGCCCIINPIRYTEIQIKRWCIQIIQMMRNRINVVQCCCTCCRVYKIPIITCSFFTKEKHSWLSFVRTCQTACFIIFVYFWDDDVCVCNLNRNRLRNFQLIFLCSNFVC